ncbi:MAG TPA: NAD(P)/FAD-dependent oxidoreductase [Vicinamibacterales bacterium]|nr:NAD(P)/FAD-dependent oxidoreductase [Vicinamibacterales bacterium]
MTQVVIIGGGHNGLVAAFYLAKAGLKPLVLERSSRIGGGAITTEISPGFHCPTLSHEVLIHDQIVSEMGLRRDGLGFLSPEADVCAISTNGDPLVLWNDNARTADALRARQQHDGQAYLTFRDAVDRAAALLGDVLTSPPPDIDSPGAGDVWRLLKTGREFRGLGKRGAHQLLRWLPMPIADFAREWFEDDLLRAAIAGPGVSGTMFGPRSAGSTLVMLLREAHRRLSGQRRLQVRGGPGRLTQAMAAAATAAGAEIRTGAKVERIVVRNERVAGVVVSGREITSDAILSCVDPKTTFLELFDPVDLTPDLLSKMRHYRAQGTVAKINLALAALPPFRGVTDASMLTGHIHIGPDLDYLERAFDHVKYGEVSMSPWLHVTVPSVLDASLAPAGAHVMSVYAHYAPYSLRGTDWPSMRQTLLTRVLATLEHHAPGLGAAIVSAQIITPADMQNDYGFSGGHIFHGELAPDQLYAMRPLLGAGRYESPVRGVFLCGAGTHPGGFMSGINGRLAAQHVLRSASVR